jgi:hypothetical protein
METPNFEKSFSTARYQIMLTDQRLKDLLRKHFDAEAQRDVQWIMDTVSLDCEYDVIGPCYPDDPVKKEKTAKGRSAVGALWENYYRKFARYEIDCPNENMITWPEQGLVFAQVNICATPSEEFEGFPAGKPFRYQTGALCWFGENGEMTREKVFGSLGQVLMDLRRMRDFLDEDCVSDSVQK